MIMWKQKKYKDGSLKLTEGHKEIFVHKSMGKYWIDYTMKDWQHMGTLAPVDKKNLGRAIQDAKNEFRSKKAKMEGIS